MKFLNDVNITGNGADLSCAATVTFSNLSTTTGTYAVMANNSTGVLAKRQLGNNAFNSTTIPTNNNQLTNGANYITSDTRWSGSSSGLTASTGRTSLGATTIGGNLFTLSNPGAIRFPRFNANNTVSSLSASDFRTAIGATDTNTQLSNDGVIAAIVASTDISTSNKSTIRTNIGIEPPEAYSAAQVLDWTVSQTQNIHANNYTNTTYSVGDGGLTQNNFTNTLKSKLDGIDNGANAYTLPAASTSAIGGVIIKSTTTNTVTPAALTNTANRTYAVQLAATGSALVVNVPWSGPTTDTASEGGNGLMSSSDKIKLDEIAEGATANIGDVTTNTAQTISGAKTLSGLTTISNTTDSSSATGGNGALRTTGGASIAKKLYVGSTITGSADVVAYSDEKLKENVKTLNGKKVLDMRGVSFDRVDTGKASSGVIAQEIEKVAPELVIDDGNYKGVAYGNLVGYLIEAIKDQQKQINELKYILHGRPE
tara:strand:+ start:1272 stop:2720 length:1449 start_codon:yes stop_codon:yes gene_type:complete